MDNSLNTPNTTTYKAAEKSKKSPMVTLGIIIGVLSGLAVLYDLLKKYHVI
nr:hypothetical protein [Mucilaginibacter sp. FT3.2]